MIGQNKPLLVLSTQHLLTSAQMLRVKESMTPVVARLGMELVVLPSGVEGKVETDLRPLLSSLHKEQSKTNELLTHLIQALAEGDESEGADDIGARDLAGRPIKFIGSP